MWQDKIKEGFKLVQVVNYGKVTRKYMGQTSRCYFSRFVWTNPFWYWLPVSGDKNVLSLAQGGHLSHGSYVTRFWVKRGKSGSSSCICCFSSALAQNNQYAKVVYLGVACSEPLHVPQLGAKRRALCLCTKEVKSKGTTWKTEVKKDLALKFKDFYYFEACPALC